MNKTGSLVIGYDFSNGTDATIINAFSGEEAEKIFEKLASAKNTTPLMSK